MTSKNIKLLKREVWALEFQLKNKEKQLRNAIRVEQVKQNV